MMNKKLVLNPIRIMTLAKDPRSMNRIHRLTGIPYQTIHRYFRNPGSVQQVGLDKLGAILSAGLGLTQEEIENLKIGDVFQVVENAENE